MSAKTSLSELDLICKQAQEAKIELRRSSKAKKNDALKYAAEFLLKNKANLMHLDIEIVYEIIYYPLSRKILIRISSKQSINQ